MDLHSSLPLHAASPFVLLAVVRGLPHGLLQRAKSLVAAFGLIVSCMTFFPFVSCGRINVALTDELVNRPSPPPSLPLSLLHLKEKKKMNIKERKGGSKLRSLKHNNQQCDKKVTGNVSA
ncbi:hypothetical protein L195_g031186 [Trifolium pratense]|uniref:Uncharacterized protein n=1 Tax=Trifolium pratense TaxID=57577 RepID=A0A2K3L9Q2_TRIPR|nr:hypothetical protein L195_g031186 [Trifolium pratense]